MKSSQLCSSSTVVCKQALFEQSATASSAARGAAASLAASRRRSCNLPWLKAENRVAVDVYIFLVPIGRARPIGMCVAVKI